MSLLLLAYYLSTHGVELAFRKLALPNREHVPAQSSQRSRSSLIARNIFSELGCPELHVRFGSRGKSAAWVAVPEASVHKHDSLVLWEHQIWSARQLGVETESQSGFVKKAPHSHFSQSILSPNSGHHSATGWLVNYVHGELRRRTSAFD